MRRKLLCRNRFRSRARQLAMPLPSTGPAKLTYILVASTRLFWCLAHIELPGPGPKSLLRCWICARSLKTTFRRINRTYVVLMLKLLWAKKASVWIQRTSLTLSLSTLCYRDGYRSKFLVAFVILNLIPISLFMKMFCQYTTLIQNNTHTGWYQEQINSTFKDFHTKFL